MMQSTSGQYDQHRYAYTALCNLPHRYGDACLSGKGRVDRGKEAVKALKKEI
jgi:hypothetical protein